MRRKGEFMAAKKKVIMITDGDESAVKAANIGRFTPLLFPFFIRRES